MFPRVALALLLLPITAGAQPFLVPGGQNNAAGNGNALGLNGFDAGQNQQPQGGGANADFESLIELIVSTVNPDSWAENGGGEAEIRPYVNGVYADAQGVLSRVSLANSASDSWRSRLEEVRKRASSSQDRSSDVRSASGLRFVSLGRLESELSRRRTAGEPVEEAMLTLAGLRRVQYVVHVPCDDERPADLLLAGPAADWLVVGDGRIVSVEDGLSVVRLDDLLTLLRRRTEGAFGCSIDPRPESLSEAQSFLNASSGRPVSPGKRSDWLEEFRSRVGEQDIRVFGLSPTSRAAGVLVEADHHMKLIGMGLVDGVPGVESYLDGASRGRSPSESTGVLRWWFAMNYSSIQASPDGEVFGLVGPGAKVVSETELLTRRGERAAAAADPLADLFAESFTKHFDELCRKYPVYSELRNVFDLALVAEIARQAVESNPASWRPRYFMDSDSLKLPEYETPRTVQTVVNHRVVSRRRFVAGVSGGVWGDARSVLSDSRDRASEIAEGVLDDQRTRLPQLVGDRQWWWDAEE